MQLCQTLADFGFKIHIDVGFVWKKSKFTKCQTNYICDAQLEVDELLTVQHPTAGFTKICKIVVFGSKPTVVTFFGIIFGF